MYSERKATGSHVGLVSFAIVSVVGIGLATLFGPGRNTTPPGQTVAQDAVPASTVGRSAQRDRMAPRAVRPQPPARASITTARTDVIVTATTASEPPQGPAAAQNWGHVQGVVRSDDGTPVSGAMIDVRALGRGTTSDASGRYELSLPAGEHTLRIHRMDHVPIETQVVIPPQEAPIARDWRLQRRDLQLPPVAVRASRHTRSTNPGSHVLSGADIQEQIGGLEDVMRNVQSLPGVGSASDFHGEIFVRGAGTHANAVYLDGIPIFFPYHILGFNSIFNPGIVESAEFYAGGAPAAYGGATGGVLLVRSHGTRPSDHRGDAGLSYVSAHVRAAGGDEQQGWALSLRRSYHDQVLRWVDPENTSQIPSFYDAMARARWKPSPNHRVVVGLLLAGDGLSIPSPEASALRHDLIRDDATPLSAGGPSSSRDRLGLDNQLAVGSLTWRALLGPRAWLETVVGYVPQRLGFSLKGENNESVQIESRTITLRQDLSLQKDAHHLRFGFEGYRAQTDGLVSAYAAFLGLRQSNSALNVSDQKERYQIVMDVERNFAAVYAQDDWSLRDGAVELGTGLRYERDGLARQDLLSPRLAATFRPASDWSLRGTWGVSHALRSTPLEVQPTRSGAPLGAERATEATLGLSRHRGALQGGVSAYVKRFDDLVYEAEPAYYANGGRGRSHGVETWLQLTPARKPISLRAQYAWSKTEQRDESAWRRNWTQDAAGATVWGTVSEEPYWYRPFQDQRHQFAVEARLRHRSWEFGANLQLASGLPFTPITAVERDAEGNVYGLVGRKGSAQLPAYRRLDLRLLRHFQAKSVDWRVFVEVLNATSAENVYMQRWNRDYTQQYSVTMVPLLPTVGVEASF